ncbi:MAG TPA: GspE/PulE family protein [Burkholderiales bacterium]|nr:GspE/PulE family protein [Burkholderiales bacterium]
MNAVTTPGVIPLTAEDLAGARAEQTRLSRPLIDLLYERADAAPAVFMQRLSETFRLPALTLDELRASTPDFDVLPFVEAQRRSCLALRDQDHELQLVLGDPYEAANQDWLEESVREPFTYALAFRQDILAYLAQQETGLRAMDGVIADFGTGPSRKEGSEELSIESIAGSDSPVVRLVNSTLYDALKAGASDIHLETASGGLTIKYRLDGVLAPVETINGVEFADQVISRVKVMAELDIAERRVPQDGRFRARRSGRDIDIRVSIMPSVFGEDAVLRILDKQSLSDQLKGLTLDQLRFDAHTIKTLRRLAAEPHGMLLVTGPTGSGKTTTLYAVITEANSGLDKIITIEDPVEYQLSGVLQIPVNEKKGLTFARGLRSILRHDPDRIMVGEIRDSETAEIAIQSALTGHLVYTTVHANSVFDVIGRFLHMKVDPYNFVSALNGVMAQRLLRINCAQCSADANPEPGLLAESGLPEDKAAGFRFRKGRGCAHCRGTGFRGRRAIGELLVMSDELRQMIASRVPARELKDAARAAGTRTLRESALELVREGETSLEEANRVTFVA